MFQSPVYAKSPRFIQELLISAWAYSRRRLREGRQYRQFLERARQRQAWPRDQLLEYQRQKLRELLEDVARNTPYYAQLFQETDFDPANVELPAGLSALPLLTKKEVVAQQKRMMSANNTGMRFTNSTSGTTGSPLTVYQDLHAISREFAFLARQLDWAGYKAGEPRAWIRGDLIVPADDRSGPFWRHNRVQNMLMMSSYHVSESNAPAYMNAINAFKPTVIQAYPSAVAFLARYLESQNQFFNIDSLRAIVTTSESLSEEDRNLIEERFCCKLFDWYGALERVAAIGTCEHGTYHLITDYSYVEFEPTADGPMEIIGTGFNNFVMPLIRYKTGDLVDMGDDSKQCLCGRAYPTVRTIYGRSDDCIKLSDGRQISHLGFVFHGLSGIAQSQIVQDELDRITILIVPFAEFPAENVQKVTDNVRHRLGDKVKVDVELVQEIPKSANGKSLAIVCNI